MSINRRCVLSGLAAAPIVGAAAALSKDQVLEFLKVRINDWYGGTFELEPSIILESRDPEQIKEALNSVKHISLEAQMIHKKLTDQQIVEYGFDEEFDPRTSDIYEAWSYHFEHHDLERHRFNDLLARPALADESGWETLAITRGEEPEAYVCWKDDVVHVTDGDFALTYHTWFGVAA